MPSYKPTAQFKPHRNLKCKPKGYVDYMLFCEVLPPTKNNIIVKIAEDERMKMRL